MPTLAEVDIASYAPIGIIILMAITFAVINLVGTFIIGPKRKGERKGITYESGMTPVGTARRLGVSWGFHNDPPGTPQLPWVGADSVVNRRTDHGNICLGEHHRVTVEEALHAMTLEAAWQLHLDHEIGSIQAGKKADFCVLEADPLEMDPLTLRDMPVWDTVFGGKIQPA